VRDYKKEEEADLESCDNSTGIRVWTPALGTNDERRLFTILLDSHELSSAVKYIFFLS
jgi:hypothetical protein